MEGPGLQQPSGLAQRPAKPAVGLATDAGMSGVGRVQAEDHAHGGGLARAVQAQEAGHGPRRDVEAEPVDGDR